MLRGSNRSFTQGVVFIIMFYYVYRGGGGTSIDAVDGFESC
jgi:hypothetical protein